MSPSVRNDDAIPEPAALVRDFVNTVEWQVDRDSWHSPPALAFWLSTHTRWDRADLDFNDLALARRVREGLRSVLLMHAGHEPFAATLDDLNDALQLIPLRIVFENSAALRLEPAESTAGAEPLAHILEAVDQARADGSWSRLKACSRDSCRWAYWDTSRNRSGRWCSMAGCGNYIKMRRRNGASTGSDEAVIGDSATRQPTLVDVAARAGVSIKTVSNVVTGRIHVAESTSARVNAAITELDYQPNLAARSLASSPRRAHLARSEDSSEV